jgi:hypothetical protein
MGIRFLVSDDDDLIWDVDDHSEPITEQQATLIALRRIAVSLSAIADVLHDIAGAKGTAAAPGGRPASAAAKSRKRKVAAKRKKFRR